MEHGRGFVVDHQAGQSLNFVAQLFGPTFRALLTGLPRAGVKRLVWVGAGGLLQVAPGVRLFDTPQFPAPFKAEMLAQAEALELFRANTNGVEWSFSCPPPGLYPGAEPGQRTGRFRTGGDQLLTNEKGESSKMCSSIEDAFKMAEANTQLHHATAHKPKST